MLFQESGHPSPVLSTATSSRPDLPQGLTRTHLLSKAEPECLIEKQNHLPPVHTAVTASPALSPALHSLHGRPRAHREVCFAHQCVLGAWQGPVTGQQLSVQGE